MNNAITAFFFLLPSAAMAIPVNPDSVYLCDDINYAGICTQYPTSLGNDDCNYIEGDISMIKSIRVDDGLDCIFYSNGVCRAFRDPRTESLAVHAPGNTDLVAVGSWTQPLRSYTCVSINTIEYADGVSRGGSPEPKVDGFQGAKVSVSS